METLIVIIQTNNDKTSINTYGAKSVAELMGKTMRALRKDDCRIFYHDNLDIIRKALA